MRGTDFHFIGDAPTTQGGAFLGSPNVTVYYRPGTKGWSNKYDTCNTVMWNPANTQPGMSNHAFGFNIAGTANIEVVPQATTNLANPVWVIVTNLTLVNGTATFSEGAGEVCPGRFYRLTNP
jgi:hypothetical protein